MNKRGFTVLEMLIIIVAGATIIIGGIILSINLSRNAKVKTFKEDAELINLVAKNEFRTLEKTGDTSHILKGEYDSMCITINGLIKNKILTDKYEKYEGYVVVEKKGNDYTSSIWITDKNFMINGYEEGKIKDLSYKKGVDKYNSNTSLSAKSDYTSASKDNGGTGLKYSGTCINEKIEKSS